MGPEAVFIGDIANLPEHAVFVFVAIASLNLMRMMAFFLFPLFVSFVIDHFIAVLVGIEFMFVFFMVLLGRSYWKLDRLGG